MDTAVPQVPPQLLDGGKAVISQLETELAEEIERRRAAEKTIAALPTARRGLTLAQRDRDAGTTSALRQLEDQVDRSLDALRELEETRDFKRRTLHLFKLHKIPLDELRGYEQLCADLDALDEFLNRDEVRRWLRTLDPQGG